MLAEPLALGLGCVLPSYAYVCVYDCSMFPSLLP